MDPPSSSQCTGSPTFNLANPGDNKYSEWPSNVPGLICKTPPIGYGSAERLPQCCSGPVYNITSPTSPDDPAYPVSCALFCQIDPELNETNEKYPYGFSEFFMCLNNGNVLGEEDGGPPRSFEVVCGTVTADNGEPSPTSYESTWTGDWQTRSWVEVGGVSWTWVEEGETYSAPRSESTESPRSSPVSDTSATSTSTEMIRETHGSTSFTSESTSTASSTSAGDAPATTTTGGDATDDATGMSNWTLRNVLGLVLVASFLVIT